MNVQRNQSWGVRKEGYDVVYLAHSQSQRNLSDRKPKQISAVRFSGESRNNDSLKHYGVQGMHWGEITKEYEPVAFDKRKLKKASAVGSTSGARRSIGSRLQQERKKARQQELDEIREAREAMKANRERRDHMAKMLVYGGVALAGLLSAYGIYRYTHVAKAKAYTGIMNRFLKQNPGALGTGRAAQLAAANSKSVAQAHAVNRYLSRKGLGMSGKRVMSVYSAKNLIAKLEKIPKGKTKLGKAIFNKMRNRTRDRIFDKLYF